MSDQDKWPSDPPDDSWEYKSSGLAVAEDNAWPHQTKLGGKKKKI